MLDKFKKFASKNKNMIIIVGVVIIVVIIIIILRITLLKPVTLTSEELQKSVEQQTEILTTNVSDKITLPDETPVVGTVTDVSQLSGDIFKNAKDGDKILTYLEAGLMVVYRESTDEIIATGPIKEGSVGDENNIPIGVEE